MEKAESKEHWDLILYPQRRLLDFNLLEAWRYRDLMWLFVKRDFIVAYKQTLLGPLWHFLQPAITSMVFYVVFSDLIGIPTDKIPPLLFYVAGVTLWGYFSSCVSLTSSTFTTCANFFEQAYFPRIVFPISILISQLVKLGIQFLMLTVLMIGYSFIGEEPHPGKGLVLIPFLIINIALLSLGIGMIISSLTAKYRDFSVLVNFGLQSLMFVSPIIYPLSSLHGNYRAVIEWNPLTPIMEAFRYALFARGEFSLGGLVYSGCFTIILLAFALVLFRRVEQNFLDYA